jgi:hypothetical protein
MGGFMRNLAIHRWLQARLNTPETRLFAYNGSIACATKLHKKLNSVSIKNGQWSGN